MINWLINKIAAYIWKNNRNTIEDLLKITAIEETKKIIEKAFKYNSPLTNPEYGNVGFDDTGGVKIGEKLEYVTKRHIDRYLRKLIEDTITQELKFLETEQFIDLIVERINKKQLD